MYKKHHDLINFETFFIISIYIIIIYIILFPKIEMLSSSTARETSINNQEYNSFKSWRYVILYPTNYMKFKSTLAFFTLTFISLLFFLIFSSNHYSTSLFSRYDVVPGNFTTSGDKDEETNISHILFGIGGSAKTWNDRRHYSKLWWKSNVTRGFVWLDKEPPQPETTSSESSFMPYRVSANTSEFKYTCSYGSRSAVRMARILKESFELGLDNVRWFVMGDDDTVFFTENLVVVLGKYDHNEMYYVGGNSESVEQNVIHSYSMAYGGGGFAVSYPLAVELVRVLDSCINRYHNFFGSDQKVQGCLSEMGVPLTKELGFHQLDIRGHSYGLLAAHPVAPLVSLHHINYLEPLFPNQTRIDSLKRLVSAYEMDPGRTLQQAVCYDLKRKWSISVSWGYTVQLYPSLVTAKELSTAWLTFKTWRSWSLGPFTFNTRLFSQNPCENPIFYFMDGAEITGSGRTLTSYKKQRLITSDANDCGRGDYAAALAIQSFNVSATHFNPELWSNKAPRRHCCEITYDQGDAEGVAGSTAQILIRGCNHYESVTPY
ncbi:uncharacterized protein LOC133801359 [Humulus lupulus]|uniref:uncharacterized protein LOC133801359 n=1 Tax=Humulus lupulus TaxID=3486 RepID=UPI002B414C3E|nr:uncharacterized protein LOC133801359 [Humulus lupulus]